MNNEGQKIPNESNINLHIEKYLENYLKLDKPEFAILLSGKWGSGKTYFINQIIKKNQSKKENIKFIKISLFEISSKDDLKHKIIMKLLGIENEKGFLNKSTQIGTKIINLFVKKLGLSIYDIPIEEILNKIDNKVVFIFDDLERANISFHEILGYINNYVEILKFNVIILANELEIDDEKYQKFKEKVIGKTFEVQHGFEEILTSFIHSTTDKSEKYLDNNKSLIIDIYNKADYNNLRHIKQILLDFEYFIKLIDEKYLENQNFYIDLIKVFFLLSIEIKAGKLNKDELLKHDSIVGCMTDTKEKDSAFEEILKKYELINQYSLVFSQPLLEKILFEANINKEELNNEILNLEYFEKEQESWKKLWNYYDLEDDKFNEYLKDIKIKFQNNEYIEHEKLLHVFGILLGLSRNGLYDIDIKDLIKKQKANIDDLMNDKFWKKKLYKYKNFTKYSLAYHEKDSSEFEVIKKYIEEKSKIAFDDGLINKAKDLLSHYTNGDIDLVNKKLEQDFFSIAIFSKMGYKEYIKMLQTTNHKNLYYIFSSYKNRYEKFRIEQNLELKNDLKFWENVYENILNGISKNTQKLKYFRLNDYKKNMKKDIIDKIKKFSSELIDK